MYPLQTLNTAPVTSQTCVGDSCSGEYTWTSFALLVTTCPKGRVTLKYRLVLPTVTPLTTNTALSLECSDDSDSSLVGSRYKLGLKEEEKQ